ncbi:MAG: P-II family nitrogen regulator [Rubrivivax sp.]
MPYKTTVATVRPDVVAPLQKTLPQIGIQGMTLNQVKGFGEAKTSLGADGLGDPIRLEAPLPLRPSSRDPTRLPPLVCRLCP